MLAHCACFTCVLALGETEKSEEVTRVTGETPQPIRAKFSLVWLSLVFDVGLVQNHKR